MEYQEYMDILREQLTDRHARELVARELEEHITEQAQAYEAEGMGHEEAWQEAVRQMGDPVETGSALNRIHRPHTPWQMLLLALAVTLVSVAVQGAILTRLNGVGWQTEDFFRLVLFHVIGFIVILALLYADYTFFVRHIYAFYVGYLCLAVMLMIHSGSLMLHSDSRWFFAGGGIYMNYAILSMQPLLFAGVLYRNRNWGMRGILLSVIVVCATTALLILMETVLMPNMASSAAIAENILILYVMLFIAVMRRTSGKSRRNYAFAMTGGGLAFGAFVIYFLANAPYQRERLTALVSGAAMEQNYQTQNIREGVGTFTLTGTGSFSEAAVGQTSYEGVYLLNDIFSYFGVVVGVAVLAALAVFAIYAFRVTFRQGSQMGFLVGLACSLSIGIRLIVYVAINFGYALWYTTSVPFLGHQWLNIITNAVYVGLLLGVARNTMTVGEMSDSACHLGGAETKIVL